MTHCGLLLKTLEDGKPHSHHELYRLGMIVHSRVADLRKQGYEIAQWSERINGSNVYFYQLLGSWPEPSSLSVSPLPMDDGARDPSEDGRDDGSGEQLSLTEAA